MLVARRCRVGPVTSTTKRSSRAASSRRMRSISVNSPGCRQIDNAAPNYLHVLRSDTRGGPYAHDHLRAQYFPTLTGAWTARHAVLPTDSTEQRPRLGYCDQNLIVIDLLHHNHATDDGVIGTRLHELCHAATELTGHGQAFEAEVARLEAAGAVVGWRARDADQSQFVLPDSGTRAIHSSRNFRDRLTTPDILRR